MYQDLLVKELSGLHRANAIATQVKKLSDAYFPEDIMLDSAKFLAEVELVMAHAKGTETVVGVFNHKTYEPIIEAGANEFWGTDPTVPGEPNRMRDLLAMLDPDYQKFPVESVNWQASTLAQIPPQLRQNMRFIHCGIRYRRTDGKLLCLFSSGEPIQYDKNGNFTYTFNYVQNVAHLLKKDWKHYWIRLSYGPNSEYVQTYHSANQEDVNKDLLSTREKEIVQLIAQDYDTKEIAEKLFISVHTVGNHRSNMIERLGVRDTTALVQLAKLSGMV